MKRPLLSATLLTLTAIAIRYQNHPVQAAEAPVTYSGQIARILNTQCATCHHEGGAGPFSLGTYKDALRWAPQILSVTQSRYMPPWLPEPGFADFADSRRLPEADRELLRLWVSAGMPLGDAAAVPPAPVFTGEWGLGSPDLVLDMPQAFTAPANGTDIFLNFVLPFPLAETRYVRAMEIRPTGGQGSAAVVHHANVLLDRTGSFRRQHPAAWQTGIPGMELTVDAGNTFDPDSHFLFWKPDSPAIVEQPGLEWRLEPGDDLILNMHLKPTGKPETIQAKIGLYFSKTPPTRKPMLLQLEHDAALDIPAGASAFTVEDELRLPIAVTALGVYPHAHYLGKRLEAWAILPNGHREWLVLIRDWDIDRQSVYRYHAPLLLPKGTVLHMRYVYDNSAANPHNPHSPPIRVHAGNRSEDEMGHLWLQVLPVDSTADGKDARLLLQQAWMQARLRKNPNDTNALYNLAAADAEAGLPHEAIPIFRGLLVKTPGDVRALTALGTALNQAGDWQQSIEVYTQAIQAAPNETDARFDLAQLDLAHERYTEAAKHFQFLIAADPKDAAAHAGLGTALVAKGETAAAEAEFIASLSLHDDAVIRQQLAAIYVQDGRMDDAAAQLSEAIRLNPNDPGPHAMLSQLDASADKLPEAIAEEQIALRLAPGDPDGWNNLGVLHVRTGDRVAAQQDFNHALALDPAHQQAAANLRRLSQTQTR